MITIKKSSFTDKSQSRIMTKPSPTFTPKATEEKRNVEEQKVNIDTKTFEVHLEDSGVFIVDLEKTKNYKIKNGYLYKGLFKKIGKIKFIRIKK